MLQLKQVSVSIEEKPIIFGLSLKVNPGEIHALMGPNGSGKSTLAYALAGHPHYIIGAGSTILLDGENLTGASPDQRAQAGLFLAFQYPVAIPGVSVQNFLKAALDHQGKNPPSVLEFRQKLAADAEKLGLKKSFLTRSVNDGFSGGEKKRLEMLQLMTLKPKYAILDETDSGLDIDSIKLVARSVRSIADSGQTGFIIVTHYRRILDYLKPDKVHIMAQGNLKQSGGDALIEKVESEGYRSFLKK